MKEQDFYCEKLESNLVWKLNKGCFKLDLKICGNFLRFLFLKKVWKYYANEKWLTW